MVLLNAQRIESIVRKRIEECQRELNSYEELQVEIIEYKSMGAKEDFLKDFQKQILVPLCINLLFCLLLENQN